ncbi:glycerophosphodiester phosphodiesterase family protein [Microbacterium fluvii]|uniref:Glycerophosphodiester phosphodiesterase family protein n=1 Tax=Microbacterium fluvii TaxID=415215 RepID=A0ABW2HG85_9MICO|nr:glycerophosphodiester phosphodiesterase family protein [Microbacterium fluvii]MCU4672083.1 glycerophosphodiester phosphodiesterase family protein [Microbacterium fluvii]
MTHPWFAPTARPRILAHRGLATATDAEGRAIVENSLLAVAAAHALGVDYVESDCHVTADGVVVLFHDDDLHRVTGDPRRVAEVTAAELERIMEPRGGLLTLAHALDAFPDLRFNLDVKAEAAALPVGRLVAPHVQRVLVTSFSDPRRRRALAAALEATGGSRPATSAGTGTLVRLLVALAVRADRWAARLLRDVDALQIPERHRRVRVLSTRLLTVAHAAGVEVHVWTINAPDDMRRLAALGVDGIVTDRADLAVEVFRRA